MEGTLSFKTPFQWRARFWNWITALIGVVFNDAPHRNPGFQGKCPHLFSPKKLLDSFSGGVSDLRAIFFLDFKNFS